MTTKGAARPLSPRGFWGHVPPKKKKNLKSRSSEMRFPAFWASKSMQFLNHLKVLLVVVVIEFAFFVIIFIFIK